MANGYTKTFLRNYQKPVTNSNALDEREPATGSAVIPYIQGVTEPIKRILNSHNVKVAQKPFQTLGHIFAKPEDPVTKEQRTDVNPRTVSHVAYHFVTSFTKSIEIAFICTGHH